jgi:hypothetical protein
MMLRYLWVGRSLTLRVAELCLPEVQTILRIYVSLYGEPRIVPAEYSRVVSIQPRAMSKAVAA